MNSRLADKRICLDLFGKVMDLDLSEQCLLAIEIFSVLMNLAFILLLSIQKRSCWLFGIAGSLSGSLLFHEQNYLSESMLYLFYAVIGLYGYLVWNRTGNQKIKRQKPSASLWGIGLSLLAAVMLAHLTKKFNADKPFYDALSTSFGVLATFLEIYRYLSAWLYWIGINAFSIWLYASKGIWIYAALMLLYTALSVRGYRIWKMEMNS